MILERVVDDENVGINHIVLPRGEAVKEGCASSNAYLLIFRGVIALELQGEVGEWEAATIMSISFGARMRIVDAA